MMSDDFAGPKTRAYKCAPELDQMLKVVAKHEGRNASQTIRRALLLYFTEGGYFDPSKTGELAGHRTLTNEALDKADRVLP